MGKTQDSWDRMVYGPRVKKPRKRVERSISRTESVNYVAEPFPHKRKYFHRYQPPVYRAERR